MGTYATRTECTSVVPTLTGITDPDEFERLIADAERSIDGLLGPGRPLDATGLKVDPSKLPDWARLALVRAVARQVQWVHSQPAEQLAGNVPVPLASVKGPEFEEAYAVSATTRPEAPELVGRLAIEELRALAPFLRRTAVARP